MPCRFATMVCRVRNNHARRDELAACCVGIPSRRRVRKTATLLFCALYNICNCCRDTTVIVVIVYVTMSTRRTKCVSTLSIRNSYCVVALDNDANLSRQVGYVPVTSRGVLCCAAVPRMLHLSDVRALRLVLVSDDYT